jgi:hypothetical protein
MGRREPWPLSVIASARSVRSRHGSLKEVLHDRFWDFIRGASPGRMDCFAALRRRPITTEAIGSAATHPSLRGALATKQSNMRGGSIPDGRTAAPGLLRFARNDGQGIGLLVSACRLTRNSEQSVRGSPLCHTRESGYPAGRDAATQGLRLAGVASSRNCVSVVGSWMPAFAGMTRGKRPIQAPVV